MNIIINRVKIHWKDFYPRNANAVLVWVPTMALCLSVASQSSMETVERIDLGFGMEASFDLSHAVLGL